MKRYLLFISIIIFLFFLLPKAKAQSNQIVVNGNATTAATFPGTGCVYNWVNNTPGIGLASSGTGNIASFTVVNAGSSPVIATITATPVASSFAYIANYNSNTVSVINTATNTVVSTITAGLGTSLWATSVSPDGSRVYVTGLASNTVSVINTATNTVVATIPVSSPYGISVSPDGSKVYVTNNSSNTVSVINTSTNTVVATIGVGTNPYGVWTSPVGSNVYVANYGGTVSVINATTNTVVATIATGSTPFYIAVSPDGSRVYVSNSGSHTISVINTTTNAVIATIPIGGSSGSANGLIVSPDGSRLYADFDNGGLGGSLSVINTTTNTIVTTLTLGYDPSGVSVSPDGSLVYVTVRGSNFVSVINTATNAVITTVNVGSGPLSVGNFITGGTGCTPVTFTITVNPTPTITTGAVTGTISACAGTVSASPNIQQFTSFGSNLTSNITATAPTGFEVSLTAGSGYGGSVTLTQSGGTVSSIPIYVRSIASASAGNIFGNVVLSSTGATSQNVPVNGVVHALPTVNAVSNQSLLNGAATTAINFIGTTNTFNWINDTPGIGLAASGTGNIASFTAINTGSTPVVASITATPIAVGFAYITNLVSNNVSVINTSTNAVVSTIPVGNEPYGASVSPDGSRVYVTNILTNNVSVINTATNTVIATVLVGSNPWGLAVSADGSKVYVANQASNNVSVINTTTNTVVSTIGVGTGPQGVTVSPDGSRVYVANSGSGNVAVISTATNTVITTIGVASSPVGIVVSPDNSRVYVANIGSNNVSVINTLTNAVIATIGAGAGAAGVAISPDGSRVYVSNISTTTVSVINTASNAVTATVTVGNSPRGISVSPDGSHVYVANYSDNTVSVINTATNLVSATVPVGSSPNLLGNFITAGGCSGTPVTFTITVNPTAPTITATGALSALNATYGIASTSTSFAVSGMNMTAGILVTPPTGFEVSTNNTSFSSTVTIGAAGTIASTLVYIRLASSTAVGSYSGNIVLSSAGATNVNEATAGSTVSPSPLTITANSASKTYGTALSGATGSTAYTITGGSLKNGNTISSVTVAYGTGSNANSAVGTYTGSVTPSAATGANGFLNSNYIITYSPGNIIVGTAPLTITANNVNKVYGATLTGGAGSTAFTTTGLQNAETIGSITIAYGTGSAATAGVGTYTGSVTPTSATGGTFTASNYIITYSPGNIIIGTAPLTITANNVNKVYGTTLTGGAGSTAFTTTGLQNAETIGSISIAYGAGSAATAGVGTYSGSVTTLFATGGTFTAGNYTITYAPSNIIVGTAPLTITANNVSKTYGTTLTGGAGSTLFTTTGLQNAETIGSISIAYGAGSTASAGLGTYTGSVTASAATSGTFTAGNYIITYAPGNIIVGVAPLTITANNVSKVYGATLTGGAGSTLFTTTGLQNAETIGSISITYGTGSTATAAVGVYVGSVTASAALGGTFTAGNYGITYVAGNIIVNAAPTPAITVAGTLSALSTTFGTASPSTSFTVSGINMTSGILVVPPSGFEVSTDNITFSSAVTVGAAGTVAATLVYIRLASTTAPGSYSGNIVLSSAGAANINVTAVTSIVNGLPPIISATAPTGTIVACSGSASVAPNVQQFTVSGSNLTVDITATAPAGFEVSLASASGFGSNLVLTQTGGSVNSVLVYVRLAATALVGNISGIVELTSGAASQNVAVTGTVNALPTINTVSNQILVNGASTTAINFTGTGNTFNWVNDTPSIGLAAKGTGNIASFTAVNAGSSAVIATITATPLSAGFAYIANTGSNAVSVINTITNKVVNVIAVGTQPYGVSVSPDSKLVYITNEVSNNLSVVNTATNSVIATIPVGSRPFGVSVSPDGSHVYVVNGNSYSVSVINTATNSVQATIGVGLQPSGIVVSPDGKLVYVANSTSNSISVINAATNTVTIVIPVGNAPLGVTVSPDGSRVYVVNTNDYNVSVINTATNTVIATVAVGILPLGISISPDGGRIYVVNTGSNTVSAINTATNAVIATISVGSKPWDISVTPDGSQVYVTNGADNTVSVINAATNLVSSTISVGAGPGAFGNFITSGTTCVGAPVTFTIAVNPSVPPAVVASQATGSISSCTGIASSSPNILQFNVSGSNLTTNIIATAPPGFEVSLVPGSGYGYSVTLVQSAGAVGGTVVYVRSSVTASGGISGNVVLSSAGAISQNVAVAATINALPSINAIANQTVNNGTLTTAINFTGAANTFSWVNDTPGIGLAATGTGNISSFPAVNKGSSPVIANITATPQNVAGCSGTPVTFTITVNPASVITATGTLSALNTTYGTASSSTSFMIFAVNLQASILVTPPPGFEVSTNNITFSSTVILGAVGTLTSTPVYVRLISTTAVGSYSGNIVLSSSGIMDVNLFIPNSVVNPASLIITADNKTKIYGNINPVLTATYGGFVNNETPAQLLARPLIATIATILSPVGQYSITVSGAASPNYTFTYMPGVLTINAAIEMIVIPNTFTPNGDGINDTWNIKYLDNYPNATVEIFSRYGEKVYFSRNYPIPWDGTYKGVNLPVGTYYYIVNPNSGHKALSGYVTIIR